MEVPAYWWPSGTRPSPGCRSPLPIWAVGLEGSVGRSWCAVTSHLSACCWPVEAIGVGPTLVAWNRRLARPDLRVTGVVPGLLAVSVVEGDGERVLVGRGRLVGRHPDELWQAGKLGRLVPGRLRELEPPQIKAVRRDGLVVTARLISQDALKERRQRGIGHRTSDCGAVDDR